MKAKAKKVLKWLALGLAVFAMASLLSLYAYGRFAERARGEVVMALPLADAQTAIDRAVVPLTDARPGQTGMVILGDNLDAFAVRAMTARSAGRSLDLQYYIWHDDFTGNMLHNEVLRAADRGVRVRLLLDDMNVHGSHSVLAALDSHPLIEVRLFNPTRAREGTLARGVELLLRFVSLNRRMHNKIWLADGRIAVVGGRNIGDEYFDAAADVNFMDTDVAMVGSAARQAEEVFDAYWNSASAIPLAALVDPAPDALDRVRASLDAGLGSDRAGPYLERLRASERVSELLQGRGSVHWTENAMLVSDPPQKAEGAPQRPDWMTPVLVARVSTARRELKLISPYFVPGHAGLEWLSGMRGRGVEVSILTNSLAANDVLAVHGGYAGYRVPLLRAGIALYELKPHGAVDTSLFGSSGASLHTKAYVVDGSHGFIGSFNLDPRSIKLNTEMGLMFDHPGAAAELEALYAKKTSAQTAYRLALEDGRLRWHDDAAQPPATWEREPEAKAWQRAAARVIGWLPLESQL
ncbi:phospholipase D family protein [Pseudoxanthomonas sp. SGNA-20]|jgi:Phosphatidylserine/phosphatidylglycerophosphate/cardiolipin synthases and related enzymes|uniref:phospholipase D family protein n=1 Tax=unclassified Pseudoxanthomonas TaxID=2645906 RepID=UPI0002FF3DD0|nr:MULTISPECIES: phospholipase D family protein [unclassified Pseudoxanthomonas]RRN57377.1 phospholipase D family protein [Pseudoxanthomonas sp. SGNA-20]